MNQGVKLIPIPHHELQQVAAAAGSKIIEKSKKLEIEMECCCFFSHDAPAYYLTSIVVVVGDTYYF